MISHEFPLVLPSIIKKENKNELKEYLKIARKKLYNKYTLGKYSSKVFFINCILYNNKCTLTHMFKEFLFFDNNTEFLRHYYSSYDIENILSKILEIYSLYSKIYPNYIILKENKFLYKNIRKKQKLLDEKNENNENDNNKYIKEDINNKENELFTPSVRNEIKEFEDSNFNNINSNKNNNDSINNQYSQYTQNEQKIINPKKINDNWTLINNSNHKKKDGSKRNNSNNNHFKNMSFDSFWTNDTNNLSIILNAINDKKHQDNQKNYKSVNDNISKKKTMNNNSKINHKKFQKNKNLKIMEIKSSYKMQSHKNIYKKIENKNISDVSRNNLKQKRNKKTYLNQLGNINNLNMKKPISVSVSNSKNITHGLINKPNKINTYLFTEKSLNKNFYRCYSNERDNSENTLKKLSSQIIMQKKLYSKDSSKENHSIGKLNEKNMNSNYKKIYFNNLARHQTYNNEHLKNILNDSKKKSFKKKSKEQNYKKFYSPEVNNANILRNRKILLKKYFSNKNFQKNFNHIYMNNLTGSFSQSLINFKKKLDSSYNNKIRRTLNICRTASNYYNIKYKNMGIFDKRKIIKKEKTDKILPIKDIILPDRLASAYIARKFFSPILLGRYSLSKSYNIKKDKMNNKKKNLKLKHRQLVNSEAYNKLFDFKSTIRTQITESENNEERKITKTINKLSGTSNIIIDSSKESRNISNKLTTKENQNNKKVNLKKNLPPTLTYYNLYRSGQNDLSHSQNNLINNSDFIEFHHENLFIKKNNKIKIKESKSNMNQNKENILSMSNKKKVNLKKIFDFTKSKTEYSNFLKKHNKNLNKKNNSQKFDINKKNYILRIKKNDNYIFPKDKSKNEQKIKPTNYKINEFGFKKLNNLSTSTINNNSNLNQFTIYRNINNSSSNSMNNLSEFQTPLIQKKRFNLIKKFIYQDEKEKHEPFDNMDISNKMTIKVNRTKFLEKVKEKMRNKK